MVRLAIVSSHPIQYNAPLFRLLSQRKDLNVKVFYSWKGTANQNDPEFGEKIVWDIPLLKGYDYCFVENVAKDPGTHHFTGLNNPNMVQEIERWGADTLLIYGWAFRTHLTVLRHFHKRIPIFFRGDSTLLTGGKPFRQLFRRLCLTWVYKYVDVAFYPGTNSKEYFLAYGLSERQLVHVPHAIDNNRFSNNEDSLEKKALDHRNALGIPDESLVLLFAGKFVPRKQPVMLLNAICELNASGKFPPIHLIYVGTGPLFEKLHKAAKSLEFIHILGFKNQSEMPIVYRMGDLYVLPSNIETWGLGVNESMASYRPVIVSDKVGCSIDLVKAEISGEIFSADDIFDLKKTILKCVKNKKQIFDMRQSARKLIENWSIEKASNLMGDYILAHVAKGCSCK